MTATLEAAPPVETPQRCHHRKAVKTSTGGRVYKQEPLSIRFWRHVEEIESGCWKWTASVTRKGYGQVYSGSTDRRMRPAHRVSYELMVGDIPPGLELDHLCRNRRCVNPYHLDPVTGAENMRRMAAARTHCKRDHEWTDDNIYVSPTGRRECKACIRHRKERAKETSVGTCTCTQDPCACGEPTGEPVLVGDEVVGYQDELFAVEGKPKAEPLSTA